MRICFFGNFTGGGTEKAGFGVANALCESHEVYVLSSSNRQCFFELDSRIPFSNLGGGNLAKKNFLLYKYLKKNKIDVLISLEAMSGIISIIPAKLASVKLVIWEHANYFQNQGSRFIQKIRAFELKTANAYVVLTKRDLNNFKNNFKIKSKIEYIYNTVDEACTCEYDLSSKTVLSAGYIREIKNFIVIPEIGFIVFAKHPDWKWEIYGNKQGKYYERIKQRVQDLGLTENIVFCDRTNDMDAVYRKSAMYVMTSLQEGLPMVLLEAKARKLPLVSFDIETGPDEIIRDGENGFLIPPYDVAKMADAINKLIEDEKLRREFSDNARLDVEKFDALAVKARWEELLIKL